MARFGAATGAIIGAATHNVGLGAAIGAGSGVVLGGLIGAQADAQQSMRLQQQSPATYARAASGAPLSVADVTAMSKAQVNDDTIIAQIINSHTVYHLSATDIIGLHDNGVSQRVIDFMVNTPSSISPAATSVEVAAQPPPLPPSRYPPCLDRVMCGLAASGFGMADGIGRPVIGRSLPIPGQSGLAVIGAAARMDGSGMAATGDAVKPVAAIRPVLSAWPNSLG